MKYLELDQQYTKYAFVEQFLCLQNQTNLHFVVVFGIDVIVYRSLHGITN